MQALKSLLILILPIILATSCSSDGIDVDTVNIVDSTALPSDKTDWWKPQVGVSFDWDLADLEDKDQFDADVVDVDAFTTTKEQVAALHAQGKKVIAYLSVGTIENDRPDVHLLPKAVVGKVYDEWPDEKWLDIRRIDQLKPWLNSRFNMIIQKGFDAIEPDNLDSYSNETGFPISESDTRKYCDFLITMAHKNGLGIGQKNVPELAPEFSAKFDWALTEDAFDQGWQQDMQVFITKDKPVFAVEYTDMMSQKAFSTNVCPKAKSLRFDAIIKKRDLDKWTGRCQ
ncbi:endo alpha-1,4 polygalactosaminidase [Dyadobacter luticola]|uniref:Endo alpha-1,4 polygalactosaminidase n=1 Tax=Dyadobacter luticola TaxID=1979387 RepID=A0A5R9L5K9_9BACT|nr:endo alpha-1,4 polygalactosaminidase [Dyadobacter luticola]TLV03854.1 endo alpha-1,4 polygalactosaminidase [Dyadobacter luticola]